MNQIEISSGDDIPPPPWLSRVEPFLEQAMTLLEMEGWTVSVLLCGDEKMTELNEQYREAAGTTDVLSFSYLPDLSGDIAVSLETLSSQAPRFRVTEEEELKRLLIHGLLHLSGADHTHIIDGNFPESPEYTELDPMLKKQETVLHNLSQYRIMEVV